MNSRTQDKHNFQNTRQHNFLPTRYAVRSPSARGQESIISCLRGTQCGIHIKLKSIDKSPFHGSEIHLKIFMIVSVLYGRNERTVKSLFC